jgi:hypothetical protein
MSLKTKYKYIHFVRIPNPGKRTQKWSCRNNRSEVELAQVRWDTGWRQYVIEMPSGDILGHYYFSRGCLRDIAAFLDQLMEERKKK